MVWVLVGVLLVLVGYVISLDNCVELCIFVCYGQKWTDIGQVNIRIGFHILGVSIKKLMQTL
jgi:hypothetical protein